MWHLMSHQEFLVYINYSTNKFALTVTSVKLSHLLHVPEYFFQAPSSAVFLSPLPSLLILFNIFQTKNLSNNVVYSYSFTGLEELLQQFN